MDNDKHSTFCVNCENHISLDCMSCKTKTNGIPSRYCEIGSVPKKSNFDVIKAMNMEELADWLDKNGQFDTAPWTLWFDRKYCSNCESIMCHYEDSTHEFPCAWCELNDNCKFLPNAKGMPNNKETIKMWLESEEE
jgi:hypothetical protein